MIEEGSVHASKEGANDTNTNETSAHTTLANEASANDVSELTRAVVASSYYGTKREQIAQDVLNMIIVRHMQQYMNDAFIDFIPFIHRRIPHFISKYEFYGTPFEHYLMHVIKLNYNHYLSVRRKNNEYVKAYLNSEYKHECAERCYDHDPFYDSARDAENIIRIIAHLLKVKCASMTKAQKKWLLVLVLKFSYWLSEDEIRHLAHLVHYHFGLLLLIVESIRLQLHDKMEQRGEHTTTRNNLYARIIKSYASTPYVSENASSYRMDDIGIENAETLRARMERHNAKISRIMITPSNGLLSHMLNIPKGTVDSVIYKFRKRYIKWVDSGRRC